MIQGITWTTAVHVLAKTGLPKHSSIVERRTVPGGHLVVLETDLGSVHRRVGLGFYHAYYGSMNAFLGQVRIHVKTPEFIPVKEEYPAGEIAPNERYPEGKAYPKREVVVEYDPVFIAIGDQVAPKTIRHIKNRGSREGSWILEAHFQRVNDQWLLEKAYNIQGDKRWAQMVVSGVSTKPVDPKLFDVPEP
jgi:hypothetical protein